MVNERIPRVTGKIFASNAAEGDIGQFGSALTGTKVPTDDISIIQALPAYEEGWRSAVVSDRNYPTIQEMNGLQKTFSQQINYILQNGMPEWDAGTTYFTDQFCRVGSMFYVSLQDNNLGNNPTTTTGFWEIWNPAEGTYANTDLSNLSETGQQVINSKLNESQVTNCILSSSNANITNNSVSDASYVNTGCTISEAGIASGFSADNRILLSKTMSSATASTVEIPFTTGSDVNTDQTLLYINNHANSLGISGGKIILRYDGNVLSGTTTLAANTAYVALLTRTASNYTVQVKTAAGAYDDAEITLTSAVGYFAGKSIYIGGGDDSYFRGSVDLANLVIQENASNYWTYTTLSSFQTVTVSGTYQLLMPNGRNADKTLNNVTKTITLNDTLLYSPAGGEKTVLVKEDGELMIRDYYAETYDQPSDVPLNGVWMNKTANTLTEQLNTYPNFINTGVTVAENGNATGFSATAFIELPESYELGNSWELKIRAGVDATNGSCLAYVPDEDSTSGFRAFKITSAPVSGGGTTAQVTAQFRRDDVYIVNREITVSTAYEVTKTVTDEETQEPATVTGYVQTAGTAESYVTAGTQVYSDTAFETPLEQAAADTWTYTGEATVNTEIQIGYCKVGGVTLVPASTVVYSDANCTSVQATASGTDYTYSGDTAESIICSITDTITTADDTVTIGSNGAQFYLNDQTYSSTDTVQDNVTVVLGSDGEDFIEKLWLDDTYLSISDNFAWQWNGVSSSTQDFVPFVGAKLGKVTDDGTTITAMELDMPLTLAKDTDVVHNTGNEYIEGRKTFQSSIILNTNNAYNPNDQRIIQINHNDLDVREQVDWINVVGGGLINRDRDGFYFGSFETRANANNELYSTVGVRRMVNNEYRAATLTVRVDKDGNICGTAPTISNYSDSSNKIVTTKYLADHWATSAPTTTSTASKARPAVVVENYLSGTTWYRLWSDRFLEQGGISGEIPTNTNLTITLPKTYNNTNYNIVIGGICSRNDYTYYQYHVVVSKDVKTNNSFALLCARLSGQGTYKLKAYWYTTGYVT